MSKLISIRAYEYQELDEYAKNKFIDTVIKYDYFADMNLAEQIEFCEINEYFFNKYGELIGHLFEESEDD